MSRAHHRSKGSSKIMLSQLVDWDRRVELVAVVRDLETDNVIVKVPLLMVGGDNAPVVLVALEAHTVQE